MSVSEHQRIRRILVIDDDRNIHRDYEKSLSSAKDEEQELRELEAMMFGDDELSDETVEFEIVHAYQGQEAVAKVREELELGRRFPVAFVDFRMPPGWNGIETTRQLLNLDPDMSIVICTAYSDFSWRDTVRSLGRTDRELRLLTKPFAPSEVRELATELSLTWDTHRSDPVTQH